MPITQTAPKFRKIATPESVPFHGSWGDIANVTPDASYEVRLSDTLAGTVHRINDLWIGVYNDGRPAYSEWKRIDAAWSLINS